MTEMRAGVIGLGVGSHHLRVYNEHPHCRVVAACDFSQDKLQEVQQAYPEVRLTTIANDIVIANDIDIVSVASFDDEHARQVVAALDNGKHVMVEKPICLTPEESLEIQKAMGRHPNLRLSSNLPLRTCPRFARVRKAIQGGEMGTVYHLEADYYWGRVEKLVYGWRTEMDYYSVILGAAVHMVDLVIWLVGELPVAVQGAGSQLATKGTDLRYDDFACLLFHFADGKTAKIGAHGGCRHPHFHTLSVFGTEATFQQTVGGAHWLKSSDPCQARIPEGSEYPAKELRGQLIGAFVDAIWDSRIPVLVSEKDVFDVMDCCFAAIEAVSKNSFERIVYNYR